MNRWPAAPNKWQLHVAKAHFSNVVRMAQEHPQTITVNGDPRAMVISRRLFLRLAKLYDAFQRAKEEMAQKTLDQTQTPGQTSPAGPTSAEEETVGQTSHSRPDNDGGEA